MNVASPRARPARIVPLALLVCAAAVGCKAGTAPVPTGFGINVIVDEKALTAAQKNSVVTGSLQVTGAEAVAKTFDVKNAISSGELRFRYIPTVQSGTLNLIFEALDGNGAIVATGQARPVAVAARAATITIALAAGDGKKGAGTACTTAAMCHSGFCADGVCCNDACSGRCESCALSGTAGLCAGHPAETDPEMECGGATTSGGGGDAGADGGGAGDGAAVDTPVINPPDGGIVTTPNKCAGTCNGMRACAFPMQGLTCGDSFCNSHKDVATFACDGNGGCQLGLTACVDYGCGGATATCRTQCASHPECLQADYCNGNSQCVRKKTNGLTCITDAECQNGHCSNGVCCNTACDAPATCNATGAGGQCKCPGVTCAAGVACQVYYQDLDVDGFGNQAGTLVAGTARTACAGLPPPGFVADNTDCDDGDANVHPGQPAYFGGTSKGTGTFDYNCSGANEREFPEYPGAVCKFCGPVGACASTTATCTAAGAQAYLACTEGTILCGLLGGSTIKTCAGCGRGLLLSYDQGFTTVVPCGMSATFTTCNTCAAAKGTETPTTAPKVQRCH